MINNKVTQPIIHSIAKILQELHFDFDKFTEALRKDYVETVYKGCQHTYETALLCGIDRRTTDAILKGKDLKYKRAILLMVVEEVQKYLKYKNDERESFKLEADMTMAKYGNNSIDTIVKTKAYGATSTVNVLNNLIKVGIIKDLGPRFQFLGYPTPQATARDKVTTKFSEQLEQLVNDYAYQMQSVSRLYQDNDNKEEGI